MSLLPSVSLRLIAFSISQAFSKSGYFAAGCCYGRPTDSALGVVFHALGDPTRRHPMQLYEASFHLSPP
ncbi:MAG: prolipoprotein diacylglyceryl transferase [Isosphaeraceae bacterium]|nr:prolipoprotein diacylglyceryl transferase [Isosphaeraceae bacterium]